MFVNKYLLNIILFQNLENKSLIIKDEITDLISKNDGIHPYIGSPVFPFPSFLIKRHLK